MCNSIYPGAIRGRQNGDGTFKQQLEISRRNYSNAITTVQKDNLVITGRLLDELTRPVSHCIEASYFHGVTLRGNTGLPRRQVVLENTRIRRLTPRECWRLMGFSDNDYDRARAALISRFYNGRDRADTQHSLRLVLPIRSTAKPSGGKQWSLSQSTKTNGWNFTSRMVRRQ